MAVEEVAVKEVPNEAELQAAGTEEEVQMKTGYVEDGIAVIAEDGAGTCGILECAPVRFATPHGGLITRRA